MGKVVLSASMSLDGFMTGPDVGPDHPMGAGGERLHEWLFDDTPDGKLDAEVAREASAAEPTSNASIHLRPVAWSRATLSLSA